MLLNISGRTDIVAHYGEWLMERFREGFVFARNPLFPNRVSRYELSPDAIDALLFCSKNYAPFLGHLKELAKKYRLYCQFTITPYENDLEPLSPPLDERVKLFYEVEKIVGKERLAWRYDPVLITSKYTVERHFEVFRKLCEALSGRLDRCIFRFVEMFIKLEKNLPALIPMKDADKRTLALGLQKIAAEYRIPLAACGKNANFGECGIPNDGCITLERVGKANACRFRYAKHEGTRKGCHCIESRDIGPYDSCPSGCKYCYANQNAELIKENLASHDVHSPLLIGHFSKEDLLLDGHQNSYLIANEKQISLFDR